MNRAEIKMKKTRFFLAQFLIEVDVTDRPGFDDMEATAYFISALQLLDKDKKHDLKVYPLAVKPGSGTDALIESYEYRDFEIEIYQNADTVATDVPTFFAVVTNLQTKSRYGSVLGDDFENIENAKEAAQAHVDKRKLRMEKKGK